MLLAISCLRTAVVVIAGAVLGAVLLIALLVVLFVAHVVSSILFSGDNAIMPNRGEIIQKFLCQKKRIYVKNWRNICKLIK